MENLKVKKTKNKLDFGEDSVKKIFWTFAIPSIFAMLAQSLAGMVDSIFVGRFVGPEGLSGITLIMPVLMLLAGVGTMVAIGGSTLAGIHKGKGEVEKSNNYFNVVMTLLGIIAIVGTIVMFLGCGIYAKMFGAEGVVGSNVKVYGQTMALFFLPFLLSFAFSFFLKLDGKPVVVVTAVVSGVFINVILDYIFIVVLKMGIMGAAIATGASQVIPSLMMLHVIIFKSSWKFKRPKFRKKEIYDLLFNGSSEFLSVAAGSISGFILNMIIVNKVGMAGVAAYAVAMQVSSIATSIGYGIAESVQSPISFNVGAEKEKRVRAFKIQSMKVNLIFGILLAVVVFFFGGEIASLFVKDKENIEMAAYILKFFAGGYVIMGINITLATYYTAVNSPKISGALALMRSMIALVTGLIILPFIFGNSGIWMARLFCEIVTLAFGVYFIKRYPFGRRVISEGKMSIVSAE